MKHKIVTAVSLIGLTVLLVAAISLSHSEAVKQRVQRAKAYAKQQYAIQVQKATVAAERRRIKADCEKGQVAYDAQTPAYKKIHPSDRPVCNLPEVQ